MQPQPNPPPPRSQPEQPKAMAATVVTTCRITGLGRTKVYELISQGKLKTVAIGRRRLVLFESIEALLRPTAD
jgi:excisionase family DNA binding protein